MHFLKCTLAACTVSIAGVAWAETDAPPPLDPKAVEVVGNAAEFLSQQEQLSVSWFISYDSVLDGREKITQVRSGYSLLDREAGFYGSLERGMATREFFFDGATFSVNDVENDSYAQIGFSGGFEQLVEQVKEEYNLDLPIWSVLSQQYRAGYLDGADKAAYLGLTRVGGEVAHHIALSNYDEDWQVWIADDPDSPRLLMIVGTNPYSQGWPQYRAYFSGWDFAPEIGEGSFTYVPGEDSERMSWPRVPGN